MVEHHFFEGLKIYVQDVGGNNIFLSPGFFYSAEIVVGTELSNYRRRIAKAEF